MYMEPKPKRAIISFSITKGIFLLLIAIMGNYVTKTLGCRLQDILTKNVFAKQILIFFIIYFAIDFTDGESVDQLSPFENIQISGIIWIIFTIFNKMTINMTMISLLLLGVLYISHSYIDYWKIVEPGTHMEEISMLRNINNILALIIITVIIIGFVRFSILNKKHIDSSNLFHYLFEFNNCSII